MQQLLLLEDDAALGQGIRLALQSSQLNIVLCRTLAESRKALAETDFDLLLLDICLTAAVWNFYRKFVRTAMYLLFC